MGILIALAGAVMYFYPTSFSVGDWLGLLIVGAGMLANALAAILGPGIARRGALTSTQITMVSMDVGSVTRDA